MLDDPALCFAALGDATRLRLMVRLGADGPVSIAGLTRDGGVSRQAVTKHLGVLQRAGLVHCARRGRESLWQIAPQRLAEAQDWLDARARDWDRRLARLRALVEE